MALADRSPRLPGGEAPPNTENGGVSMGLPSVHSRRQGRFRGAFRLRWLFVDLFRLLEYGTRLLQALSEYCIVGGCRGLSLQHRKFVLQPGDLLELTRYTVGIGA